MDASRLPTFLKAGQSCGILACDCLGRSLRVGPAREPSLWSPPAVALRKTETSHHLSLDKANVPPEIFQKSSQLAELPQKPPPGDLPPKPTELAPKPPIGDLPPKPGELPPKPQLGDLPPKPQLADLPPKPQVKDLPPKPQLGELLAKPQTGDASPKAQPAPELTPKSHPADLSPNIPKQASEDTNDLTPTLPETPVPLPRKINTVSGARKPRHVLTRGRVSLGAQGLGVGAGLWTPADRRQDLPAL